MISKFYICKLKQIRKKSNYKKQIEEKNMLE